MGQGLQATRKPRRGRVWGLILAVQLDQIESVSFLATPEMATGSLVVLQASLPACHRRPSVGRAQNRAPRLDDDAMHDAVDGGDGRWQRAQQPHGPFSGGCFGPRASPPVPF